MKNFAVFINTDTIKDLQFIEMKIVGIDGSYAELTREVKGITSLVYDAKLSKDLNWQENQKRLQRHTFVNRTTYNEHIDMKQVTEAANYLADGDDFKIEWHFIDIDHRNMIDEIYFYLNSNLNQYDTPKQLATAV